MNLFRFIKNVRGAINTRNALLISLAGGALFTYTVGTATHKRDINRQVRDLSSIAQTAPQQGMLRHGNLLTSINVRDGRNQLATQDERAAMQGNTALDRFAANQRALENMDGALGRAADISNGEDGLNTYNHDVDVSSSGYTVGNPNADINSDNVTNVYTRRGVRNGATDAMGEGGRSQFAASAPTRSGGSGVSSTWGGAGSTSGAGVRNREGQQLSGAMPGGSNIVSQMGLDGATARANTSFGSRDGRVGRSRDVKGNGFLNDMVKKSAAAASNANGAANEGTKAFMQGSLSGGVTVDGSENQPGAQGTSTDFAPTARKLNAVGNRIKQEEENGENRSKEQREILLLMALSLVGSFGLMLLGSKLLSNLDKQIVVYQQALEANRKFLATAITPGEKAVYQSQIALYESLLASARMKRIAFSAGLIAGVTAFNTPLVVKSIEFIDKYNKSGGIGVAVAGVAVAALLEAGGIYVTIRPEGFSKIIKELKDFALSVFSPKAIATDALKDIGLFK